MTELNKSKTRKKYDAEFRRQAVEHWQASGKTAVEIGRELGLDPTRLYAWRDSLRPAKPSAQGPRSREELEAQIAQIGRAHV